MQSAVTHGNYSDYNKLEFDGLLQFANNVFTSVLYMHISVGIPNKQQILAVHLEVGTIRYRELNSICKRLFFFF